MSVATSTVATMITVRDHMTIALADAHYAHAAVRVSDALELVGYTETRFWQRVGWLLEQPAVEAAYPTFVRRQRRLRDARARQRTRRTA